MGRFHRVARHSISRHQKAARLDEGEVGRGDSAVAGGRASDALQGGTKDLSGAHSSGEEVFWLLGPGLCRRRSAMQVPGGESWNKAEARNWMSEPVVRIPECLDCETPA